MALETLSPREREIVRRLALGDKQTAIADDLGISVAAVETYISRARSKVDARSTLQLVILWTTRPADIGGPEAEL